MSKNKRFLFFLTACLMFCTLCFSVVLGAGCSVVSKTLESITVDEAKMQYFIGDEFDGGIKVTAHYALSDETTETLDVSDKVTVDSSAYKKDVIGDYVINVSYTEGELGTVNTSYTVNVTQRRDGLALSFKEGMGEPIYLSADKTTADISAAANWIEVRQPDERGEVSDSSPVLDSDYYTVKVYKGKEEVTDLTSVKRGAYQIWASRYDAEDDFTYEGFILYYVVDEVQSLTLADGRVTQERSLKDTMTSTWKFTVTYASGDTTTVDKTNMYLNIPVINTNAGTTNQNYKAKVTVSYNEPLPNGAAQSIDTSVGYTLTGVKAVPDMAILDAGKLTGVSGEIETEFLTFELISLKSGADVKSTLASNRGGTVNLPSGLEIDNSSSLAIGQAWQSGGTSSLASGGYINFKANRNFEIYVYAHSNATSTDDRYIVFETNDDYALMNPVDTYKGFGLGEFVGPRDTVTVHAQSVTEVSSDGVDFSLSFVGSINLLYVLIIFEAE